MITRNTRERRARRVTSFSLGKRPGEIFIKLSGVMSLPSCVWCSRVAPKCSINACAAATNLAETRDALRRLNQAPNSLSGLFDAWQESFGRQSNTDALASGKRSAFTATWPRSVCAERVLFLSLYLSISQRQETRSSARIHSDPGNLAARSSNGSLNGHENFVCIRSHLVFARPFRFPVCAASFTSRSSLNEPINERIKLLFSYLFFWLRVFEAPPLTRAKNETRFFSQLDPVINPQVSGAGSHEQGDYNPGVCMRARSN